ncbi:hypothetical protein ACIG47_05535 [Promicromonospora sp. NPDC052451]|uniref:hypothetical protein n=1 Tax=Promicromonospora sp. NPDC052451 TaxID=3364407 RepID=UPI0037C502CF
MAASHASRAGPGGGGGDVDRDRRARSGLLVDELLPHPDGVRHELAFTGGTITVVAHDLTAGRQGKTGPKP